MHPSRAFAAWPLLAVGDVGGDRPFPDPARIRFNATLDRPEPDAPASAAAESSAPPAAAPAGKPWWQ